MPTTRSQCKRGGRRNPPPTPPNEGRICQPCSPSVTQAVIITKQKATTRIAKTKRLLDPPPLSAASPNKRTRSTRRNLETTIEDSVVELNRVSRIARQFANRKYKPCSVFGIERQKEWGAEFFFCGQCKRADDIERAEPNRKLNRTRRRGPFTCIAKHTHLLEPTDIRTVVPPPPKYQKKKRRRRRLQPAKQQRNTHSRSKQTQTFNSVIDAHAKAFPNAQSSTRYEPEVIADHIYVSDDEDHGEDKNNRVVDDSKNHDNAPTKDLLAHFPEEALNTLEVVFTNDIPQARSEECPPRCSQDDSLSNISDANTPSCTQAPPPSPALPPHEPIDPIEPRIPQAPARNDNDTIIALQRQVDKLQRQLFIAKDRNKTLSAEMYQKTRQHNYATKQLEEARKEICDLQDKAIGLPKSCFPDANGDILVDHIRSLILEKTKTLCSTSKSSQHFFNELGMLMLDENIHGGQLKQCTYNIFRQYVRDYVFTPYKILKTMDEHGGVLNYHGLELLRHVETDGTPNQRTLIPSSSSVQEYAAMVEAYGRTLCPFVMIKNKKNGSEGFSFRAADVITNLLRSGKILDTEALYRSCKISQSLDGALFTKNLSHTLGGVKFNDPSNPYQQSRNGVFPITCVAMPESLGVVEDTFEPMFKEIREACSTVLPNKFKIQKITCTTNCDMSCDWKLMGRGGATKVCTFPCAKCTIRSGNLHLPTTTDHTNCKVCIQLGHDLDPEWKCHHTTMCTEENLVELQEEVDKFKQTMPQLGSDLSVLRDTSEIWVDNDPRVAPTSAEKSSLRSIHFDLSVATREQRLQYSRSVTHDLRIRRLTGTGRLEDRQIRLKQQHKREWSYRRAYESLQDAKTSRKRTAMVLMLDSIPCLLHLENRMGLKILTLVLKEGLTTVKNAESATPFLWMSNQCDTQEKRIQAYLREVNRNMSERVLGSELLPSHWKMPYDEKKKKVATICMDNVRIRKVLAKFEILLALCVSDEVRRELWQRCIGHYRLALKKVNVRHDMKQREIFSFQRQVDYFFRDWLTLHGEEGVTNYAHMLGSGHLMEYLNRWRNLWAHSQQGWEGKFFASDSTIGFWSVVSFCCSVSSL